jgi:hypothetical protein
MDNNDKKIIIKAAIDETEFDTSIKSITRKIQQMQQQMSTGQGIYDKYQPQTRLGALAKQAYGDIQGQTRRELYEMQRVSTQEAENTNKKLRAAEKLLKIMADIKSLSSGLNEDEKKLVDNTEKQTSALKKQLQEQINGIDIIKRKITEIEGPMTRGKVPSFTSRVMDVMGGWKGVIGAAVPLMGQALSVGGDIYQHRAIRDRLFLSEQAEQQRVANMSLQNQLKGEGSRNILEAGERRQALAMAITERARQQEIDPMKALGRGVMSGFGMAWKGAIGGAVMGGVPGAAVGAIGGFALGAGGELGSKRTFDMLFDRNAYRSTLNTEAIKNYEQNLASQRMLNPAKFIAQDLWLQNYQRYQQVERAVGTTTQNLFGGTIRGYGELAERPERRMELRAGVRGGRMTPTETEEDFQKRLKDWEGKTEKQKAEIDEYNRKTTREGWYRRNMTVDGQARFSQERIEQAAGELLAAGRGSDFVKGEGAQRVAVMQQMGITNAGRLMGRAAGIGEGSKSEDTVKRLIADAMAMGIDSSALNDNTMKFSEDMRRLLEVTTTLYVQTGGAMGAVQEFEKGVIGPGAGQIQGAQTAFEIQNKMAGEGGGYRGALKWSFLNSEKGRELFQGVSEKTKMWAVSANIDNLDENDPSVMYMAQQMGKTPKEALNAILQLQQSGMFYSAETDKAREEVQSAYKKWLGDKPSTDKTFEQFRRTPEGIKTVGSFFDLASSQEADEFAQMNKLTKTSFVQRQATVDMTKPLEETKLPSAETYLDFMKEPVTADDYYKKLEEKEKSKSFITQADEQEASRSKDQLANMDILNEQLGGLAKAAQENTSMTQAQTRAMTLLTAAIDGLKDYLSKGGTISVEQQGILDKLLGQYKSANQVQAGPRR